MVFVTVEYTPYAVCAVFAFVPLRERLRRYDDPLAPPAVEVEAMLTPVPVEILFAVMETAVPVAVASLTTKPVPV